VHAALDAGRAASTLEVSAGERAALKSYGLITLKPMLLVGNIAESEISDPMRNAHYARLVALAEARRVPVIPICSKLEAEIQDLRIVD
jgi:hypothetical protein